MLTEMDRVRLDVVIGSIRAGIQTHIDKLFNEHRDDFSALVDRTIESFDWESTMTKQIDEELNRHAKSFVQNSMRCISGDFDKYKEVQRECDDLVKLRLTELYINAHSATVAHPTKEDGE